VEVLFTNQENIWGSLRKKIGKLSIGCQLKVFEKKKILIILQ